MSGIFDRDRDRNADALELDDDVLEQSRENVLEGWPREPSPPTSDGGDTADRAREHAPDEGTLAGPSLEDTVFHPPPEAPEEPPAVEAGAVALPGEAPAGAEPGLPAPAAEPEPQVELEPAAPPEAWREHLPGELVVPPGYSVLEGRPEGRRRAVAVVVSRFNGEITGRLLEGALAELDGAGVAPEAITVMPVPGAFELPLAAMALAKTRRFACIVALGCVVRGDTPHFDYVAGEAASGLQLAALETGVPVAFGVLTLDRAEQADERIDKGAEAVRTALEMADAFAQLRVAAAR